MLSTTGTAIAATTQGDRKRHNSKPTTSTVETIDNRSTSPRMSAAASRANTGGPVATSVAGPGFAAAKAACTAFVAASPAATFVPGARMAASSRARSRSAANHTPCRLRTSLAPVQVFASARKAPVGSLSPNRQPSAEAEDCSTVSTWAKSARNAGTANAVSVTAGDSR